MAIWSMHSRTECRLPPPRDALNLDLQSQQEGKLLPCSSQGGQGCREQLREEGARELRGAASVGLGWRWPGHQRACDM